MRAHKTEIQVMLPRPMLIAEELGECKKQGEKGNRIGPDTRGAYEKNEFNEPRGLHPPILFSSVRLLSCIQFFVTPWSAAPQASLSITNSWSLLKLMFIMSVVPSDHLILCHPLLLPPSIFPSIRVFSNLFIRATFFSFIWEKDLRG